MTKYLFEPFPGTDAEVFIQWKGTTLCMDFRCPCGADGHVDSMFVHHVQCDRCGSVFELGTQVRLTRVPADVDGSVVVADSRS